MRIKYLIFATLLIILILITPGASSRTAVYYLGDAIVYNNQIIIGSTNMDGNLELLKLSDNKIIRTAKINWAESLFSSSNKFYGFTFSLEQGSLYAYLVDGRYLYKYDISDQSSPALVFKLRDNNWDYFMGVERRGDNIITFGVKGIKVWNLSGQNIDSFNLVNKFTYNLNYQTDDLIIDVGVNSLKIFDKSLRQYINEIPFFLGENHNRKTFVDQADRAIYLVDDGSLKKYDYEGNLNYSFKHISDRGYDVDGSANQDHLYFTDGRGIVKFAKNDLKPLAWAYTTDLGEKNGWAMGLEVLRDGVGEIIIIFNNSSILVLDENLKLISHLAADAESLEPRENLFLRLDKNRAAGGSQISLSGGGYASGEELAITFAKQNYMAKAGRSGRFTEIITVPAVSAVRTDIKAIGKNSGLSYSISFEIE